MAVNTKVWAVAEIVTAADKNTFEQDNFTALQARIWIETGEFTGDGTVSQPVTGVGFEVRFLLWLEKKTIDTNQPEWGYTSDEIIAGLAGGSIVFTTAGDIFIRTNRVDSLDSDGFTVNDAGSNQDPNADGVVYQYIAVGVPA